MIRTTQTNDGSMVLLLKSSITIPMKTTKMILGMPRTGKRISTRTRTLFETEMTIGDGDSGGEGTG